MNSVIFIYEDTPYPEENVNIRQDVSYIEHCMEHGKTITIDNQPSNPCINLVRMIKVKRFL